jgi:HAD superfamily hydrolase (TIGR01509 family)
VARLTQGSATRGWRVAPSRPTGIPSSDEMERPLGLGSRENVAVSSDLGAVIFDFDGLMIDSERVEADCTIEALAAWAVTVTYDDFGHLFGSVDSDRQWDEMLNAWCGRTAHELDDLVRIKAGPSKDALPLMPGVLELMDEARQRGLLVGLATGSSLPTLERRLGRHGVFGRFDAIVTRSEVAAGKPAPDIYVETARRLGVSPDACLALEDSVHGCEAALAAGMRVIACPSVVTAHCTYPQRVEIVASLIHVTL